MRYTIENEHLSVEVSDVGAELMSVFHKQGLGEQLWQGDPAVWQGRSPLLFPVVGKLKDDSYLYQGTRYVMPKHGFARTSCFELVRHTDVQLELVLRDSDATRDNYPFKFALSICYSLHQAELIVSYSVTNEGNNTMYYSLGAHPGFQCTASDFLTFGDATIIYPSHLDKDMLLSKPSELRLDGGQLQLAKGLFDNDALVMTDICFDSVSLHRPHNNSCVQVRLGGAPCLGIWAKPDAPYVCIEPWFGVDDTPQVTGDIETKPYIHKLEAHVSMTHELQILIQQERV